MQVRTETLATAMFEGINFKGDFLKQKVTRQLFPQGAVSALGGHRPRLDPRLAGGRRLGHLRPRPERVQALLDAYQPPQHDQEQVRELRSMMEGLARQSGMDRLPEIEME